MSSEEFDALEFQMIEKSCMRSNYEKSDNINFSLTSSVEEEDLDDKLEKSQTPASMHFKPVSNDEPIIVGTTLKPNL